MKKIIALLIFVFGLALTGQAQTVQCQTTNGAWGPCPLNASVQLFSTQSATATATATAQKVYNFQTAGTIITTYASISGSPSGCTLQMKSGDSLGNLINNGTALTTSPANGTTFATFTPGAGQQLSDQVSVVYACTAYPSAGTISLEFIPTINATSLYTSSLPTLSSGQFAPQQLDVAGQALDDVNYWAGQALGSPSNYGTSPGAVKVPGVNADVTNDVTVQGDIAQGSADSGNPAKVGGVYNTPPNWPFLLAPLSLGNGQRTSAQFDAFGRLIVINPDDAQIIAALTNSGLPKGTVGLTGSFGRKITSTGDAIDVNVKYPPALGDLCSGPKTPIAISQTANTQLAVGGSGRWHVCSMLLFTTTAQSISVVGGQGSVCGTSTTAIMGSTTAANGMPPPANGGWTYGDGTGTVGQDTVPGNALCLFQSGSGLIAGNMMVVNY